MHIRVADHAAGMRLRRCHPLPTSYWPNSLTSFRSPARPTHHPPAEQERAPARSGPLVAGLPMQCWTRLRAPHRPRRWATVLPPWLPTRRQRASSRPQPALTLPAVPEPSRHQGRGGYGPTVPTEQTRERTLWILTALASTPLHGYAILHEVARLSGGRVRLQPGSLYGALERLVKEGLIERASEEVVEGRRRQNFQLTQQGREALNK